MPARPPHVVNLQGGKGRTGTVIICYLYYSQILPFNNINAARTLFAQKRSKIEKGIIQPSQIRYARSMMICVVRLAH
jgi:protein-tyrosine phosphatase